jgi:hypothetical protein
LKGDIQKKTESSIMATAAVAVPSASRVEPGSHSILAATLPVAQVGKEVDPAEVVREWLKKFQDMLDSGDFKNQLEKLFLKEAYWRDQLCLSWNYRESHSARSCHENAEGLITSQTH